MGYREESMRPQNSVCRMENIGGVEGIAPEV